MAVTSTPERSARPCCCGGRAGLYRRYFKRALDVAASLLGLVMLSPLLVFLSVLVRINLGSPILFRQARPGLNGEIFTMCKFRTMTDQRDSTGQLLSDEMRLTSFGKFLRASSLDELPELWNVLKGDMSLVGPRPLLVEYLPLYDSHQIRRHEVRPGLTGLAQVNGRNSISWIDRFNLDVEYVESVSLKGDITILLRTLQKVLNREGITSDTSATMEPFKGSASRG